MAINKVIYGTSTLIDLTADTVAVDTLGKDTTAHDKSGTGIVGTLESGGGGLPDNTWFVDIFQLSNEHVFESEFVSNGTTYNKMEVYQSKGVVCLKYDATVVYNFMGSWENVAHRFISFKNAPTGELLTWLNKWCIKLNEYF